MLASNTNIVVVDELTAGNLPHPGEPVPKASVVLLDGSIGRDAALRWTHFWCAQSPPVQVIVLELADEVHTIVACIEAGACGYTLRGATMSEVVASIRRAQLGQALCSPEVTARLFARVAATSQAKPEQRAVPLTGRELEVLGYIAVGYSNRSIAEALVIEVRTVKHHVHNILSKLKLSSRADAARYAVEKGWLPRLS
jgi:DNA-binding NarL/FixJ family response regulator